MNKIMFNEKVSEFESKDFKTTKKVDPKKIVKKPANDKEFDGENFSWDMLIK